MSIKRITISVPVDVAARIKRAAGKTPVSAWVTDVLEARLEDAELDRLWQEFYEEVAPRPTDVRRADGIFRRLAKAKRRNAA